MAPNDLRALCVSIHDVAPSTWPDCLRLLQAIRSVADIPLTFLVVPRYHGIEHSPASYEHMLEWLLARGHELALHGFTHQDTLPVRGSLRNRWVRTVYTRSEGEFAALDAALARQRIEAGLAWFRQRNWPVKGFVAPAWLMSKDTWSVLPEFPFDYTTTLGHFHCLPQRQVIFSPSLVYTARNATGRLVSPRWADLVAHFLDKAPLVRLSLHPRDACYPNLLRHSSRLLERLLSSREAITKAMFANRWHARQRDSSPALASEIIT